VLVNVQRGGPSTGLPTLVGQQDMMQARWGSHGDYEVIALAPSQAMRESLRQEMTEYGISNIRIIDGRWPVKDPPP